MSATSQKLNRICKRIFTTLALPAIVALTVLSSQAALGAASVTTDNSDYPPGGTVRIAGAGWAANAVVTCEVDHADGLETGVGHGPWPVTADGNGNFTTTWVVPSDDNVGATLILSATGLNAAGVSETATATFTDSGGTFDTVDFHQASNENHPTDPISWINGILNPNNSDYFEGIGVPQRVIFTGIVPTQDNTHVLTLSHQAVKGGIHAYDFLMSWDQAIATAGAIGNGARNELLNLIAQKCNGAISADGAAACAGVPNSAFPSVPDTMGQPTTITVTETRTVNQAIGCFEGIYNNRTIGIYGDAPITTASVVFVGYANGANDSDALYEIHWTSASTKIMILFAGRPAASIGACGYGIGRGASSVPGGPYHFSLNELDGHTAGSQDNQLQANAAPAPPVCEDVTISGTTPVCPGSSQSHTATITANCNNPVITWTITGNGTIVTVPPSGPTITVNATGCGSYTVCAKFTCDQGVVECCKTIAVVDTTAPVLANVPSGGNLGCNPPLPSCSTAVTATDNCDGSRPVTCTPGAISGPPCARSQTFTYSASDTCGNPVSQDVTYTWKEDTTGPVLASVPSGGNLGCNPPLPSCSTAVTATDNCDGSRTVTCTPGAITGPACARSQTFRYSATDLCLNESHQDVTYTWKEDTTGPVLASVPAGGNLGCNPTLPSCSTAVTATDNCDGSRPVTCTPGAVTGPACARSQTFRYSATDLCLNESHQDVTYTWKEDTTGPVLASVPAGGNLGCNPTLPSCSTAVTATDNCDGSRPVTCTPGAITGPPCARSRTFRYSATDLCNNESHQDVTYTWKEDTTAPVFSCPNNIVSCVPSVTVPTTATDDCDGSRPVTCTRTDGKALTDPYPTGVTGIRCSSTDLCGNRASCGFTVTVPVITASVQGVSACLGQTITFNGSASVNVGTLSGALNWTLNVGGTAFALGSSGTPYPGITVTAGANNTSTLQINTALFNGGLGVGTYTATLNLTDVNTACTASAQGDLTLTPCSFVTDTERCLFDVDCPAAAQGCPGITPNLQQFRLIYTQNPNDPGCYKLTASNPGQWFYNATCAGEAGEHMVFTVTLPYPFVTQGANPIHGYDDVNQITSGGRTCFVPGSEVFVSGQQVTLADYTDTSHDGKVGYGDTVTISIPVTVPAPPYQPFIFLAIHIDIGLKGGVLSFSKNTCSDAVDCNAGTTTGGVLIPNNGLYNFSVVGTHDDNSVCISDTETIQNCNAFKKNPGVAVLSTSASTFNPVKGLSAKLLDSSKKLVVSGVSDEDGWCMLNYKYTGKAATFYVEMTAPNGYKVTKQISLKANAFLQVDCSVP